MLGGLVAAARAAAERGHERERSHGSVRSRRDTEDAVVRREAIRVCELFPSLAQRYPEDPGVLVTLLLNHVVLAPGEAMYVAAGVVHAYASGFGLEVMAASDNVLRAGLTPKHRDVPELLDVTDFTPIPAPRYEPLVTGTSRRFDPPVADFALTVETVDAATTWHGVTTGPQVVLALADDVAVVPDGDLPPTVLSRGGCLLLPADLAGFTVTGLAATARVPS